MMPLRIGGRDGRGRARPSGGAAGARRAERAYAPPARASCPAASSSAPRWRARWRSIRRPAGRRAVGQSRSRQRRAAARSVRRSSSRDLEIGMVVVTHNRSLAARARPRAAARGWALVDRQSVRGRRSDAVRHLCKERDAVVNAHADREERGHAAASVREVRGRARRRDDDQPSRASTPLGEFLQAVHAADAARRQGRVAAAARSARRPCADFRATGRWGARAATTRSRRACASCCVACTATRVTSAAVRRAGAVGAAARSRRCGELRDRLRRAIENGAVRDCAADLRDQIKGME